MGINESIIPAKRFSFSDNQNIIPSSDFYSADYADVLNGQIPGSNTASASLSNLSGVLNNQVSGTNAIGSSLNGVSMVSNSVGSILTAPLGVVGSVVNGVGQLVNGVAGTICGVATGILSDAFAIVNTAVGGVTGVVGSVFGDITNTMPVLNSLSTNCLSGLFNGPLGITGPLDGLCGLNGYCGGGVLPSLVNSLTCSSYNSYSGYQNNPLMMSLQSNFLTNATNQALYSLGINNLMSSLSECQTNPFGIQAMNGYALNMMQQNPYSTSMLDMGNVGGPLGTNLPNLGNMVPNTISEFTNNFTYPTQPFYNINSTGLTAGSVNAVSIQNSFNAINPNWNVSSYDSIPSISTMLGGGSTSMNDLSSTDTYNAYQTNNSNVPMSYQNIANSSNWGTLNNQIANNGYNQTYLGMTSGSNNGTNYIQQLSTVNNILGSGSSEPNLNNFNTPTQSTIVTYGVSTGSTIAPDGSQVTQVNVVQNTSPPINTNQINGGIGGLNRPSLSMSQVISQGVNASSSYYSQSNLNSLSNDTTNEYPQNLQSVTSVVGSGSTANNSTPTIITNNNSSFSSQSASQLFNNSNGTQLNSALALAVQISKNQPSAFTPSRTPVMPGVRQTAYIPNSIF